MTTFFFINYRCRFNLFSLRHMHIFSLFEKYKLSNEYSQSSGVNKKKCTQFFFQKEKTTTQVAPNQDVWKEENI